MPTIEQEEFHKTTHIRQLVNVIDDIKKSKTTDDLFFLLQTYVRAHDFFSLTIGLVVNPANAKRPLQTFGKSDLPQEIQDIWFSENYIIHDPIVRYALASDGTFLWSEAIKHSTRFALKIPKMHRQFSMVEGLSVSTKVRGFPRGVFSMAHQDPTILDNEAIAELELACIHAYTRLLHLSKASEEQRYANLTKREVDILHFVAAGKTNWEIAKIYDISVGAVKKHMQNIQNKFEASNRAHASILGIKSGQIIP